MFVVLSAAGACAWVWHAFIHPWTLYWRAEQLLEHDPRRAAQLAEAAFNHSEGDFPKVQLLWSRAFLRLDQPQEALGCYSLIENPGALPASQLLALAGDARRAGSPLLATFALKAVPEASDHYIEACLQLMDVHLQGGKYREVLAIGEQPLLQQANPPLKTFLTAQAHERLSEFPEAVALYQKFLEQADDDSPDRTRFALRRLTSLALRLGRFEVARDSLADLQRRFDSECEDRLQEAELLRMEGNIDTAWQLVNELRECDSADLSAMELRATLALDRQNYEIAEENLRQVLAAQPWNKQAHYQLAQVLQRTGRADEAEVHFRENRRLTDLSVRVLALQGEQPSDPAREARRLRELAELYHELGQRHLAEQLRLQLQGLR